MRGWTIGLEHKSCAHLIFSSRVIQCFETLANNHVEQENFTDVMIVERDVAFVGTRVRQCVCIYMSSYSLIVDKSPDMLILLISLLRALCSNSKGLAVASLQDM